MTITRLHLSVTVLIALALHAGIAMWLALPAPVPLPIPPVQAFRVSLLAAVAETTTNAPAPIPEPPPELGPAIQEVRPEQQPPVKSPPEPLVRETRAVKRVPEFEQAPEPRQEIAASPLAKPGTVPLDIAATIRYEQLLVAWLEKHKQYPRRAKRLRIEGEGMLRILIDRTGRMQQVTLERRTGNRLLDKAALEMAHRADPFPPMPEQDTRRNLEFMVPVAFVLH